MNFKVKYSRYKDDKHTLNSKHTDFLDIFMKQVWSFPFHFLINV
jgi:hypothetical protein